MKRPDGGYKIVVDAPIPASIAADPDALAYLKAELEAAAIDRWLQIVTEEYGLTSTTNLRPVGIRSKR